MANTEPGTLLMLDVVDSTALTQRLGDEGAAALWAVHDRVARDVVIACHGREIDKTDGFLLLFSSVADAASCALAYHRALASLPMPLRARAALHAGPLILRENSASDVALGAKPLEVEGLAKPTVARVMSLASPGQTLLTVDARDAWTEPALRLQSHGYWRLKGVAEPVELLECGDKRSPFVPPEDSAKAYRVVRQGDLWLPARQIDNNLPQPMTSFIGRRRELAEVVQRLEQARLLTLLGTGGLGKTRLSLQVARSVLGDYPDGAWFVELAPLLDGRQVPQAVASALRVKDDSDRPVVEALLDYVRARRLLIVLDNCEHVVLACAELARQLLEAAPDVHVLATSREPLRVAGEVSFAMPTLSAPAVGSEEPLDALQQYEAVRFFVTRAQAVQPAFTFDAAAAAAVIDICRRLDGIPLALELAAARIRALPASGIAERLNDRFRLLTSGDRTVLPRQQTLHALISWSHDLLSVPERALLRRLAVFAGGWTLEAAESVGADATLPQPEVLDLLSLLVERSLVSVESAGERYGLLESVRAYALERLEASGEGDATRTRHLAYYLALAQRAEPELWGAQQGAWVARLAIERENLLAAHRWCDHASDGTAQGLMLVARLQLYWMPGGLIELGYRMTLEALARPGARILDEACSALYAASQIAYFLGRMDAALAHGAESLAIARSTGQSKRVIDALLMISYACDELGRPAESLLHLNDAVALARGAGDRARLSYALNGLAGQQMEADPLAAVPLFEESLALAREVDDDDAAAVTLQNLARCWVSLERAEPANARLRESLQISLRIGAKRAVIYALEGCSGLAGLVAQPERVARFVGAANGLLKLMGAQRTLSDSGFVERTVTLAIERLGSAAYAAIESDGQSLDLEQAASEAQAWLASLP